MICREESPRSNPSYNIVMTGDSSYVLDHDAVRLGAGDSNLTNVQSEESRVVSESGSNDIDVYCGAIIVEIGLNLTKPLKIRQ